MLRTEGPWTISRLRQVLLTLLVKNAEQERFFIKRFNDFFQPVAEADFAELDIKQALADLQRLAEPDSPAPKPLLIRRLKKMIAPPAPTPRAKFVRVMAAAFATIIILALAIWKFWPRPATDPQIRISPNGLNFGHSVVGSENTQSVTLTNIGSTTLTIFSSSIIGKDSSHFTLPNKIAGRALALDSSLEVPVRCFMTGVDALSDWLEIATNVIDSPHRVPLAAIGITPTPSPPAKAPRQRLYTHVPCVKEIRYALIEKSDDWKTFATIAAFLLNAIILYSLASGATGFLTCSDRSTHGAAANGNSF